MVLTLLSGWCNVIENGLSLLYQTTGVGANNYVILLQHPPYNLFKPKTCLSIRPSVIPEADGMKLKLSAILLSYCVKKGSRDVPLCIYIQILVPPRYSHPMMIHIPPASYSLVIKVVAKWKAL